MTTLIFEVPGESTATDLEDSRDPVIDPNGTKFLFDAASPLSWPLQADPASGNAVKDIAGGSDAAWDIAAGQAGLVDFAGRGFDFSACTAEHAMIKAPAGILDSIYAAAHDYFLIAMYLKLPTSGNWNSDTANSNVFSWFLTGTASNGLINGPDLISITQHYVATKTVRLLRQTAVGTATTLDMVATAHLDSFALVAAWRNATEFGGMIKSAAGETIATAATGSDNSADYSSGRAVFGLPPQYTNMAVSGHANANKFKLYRGFIEDLTASGRDPKTVLRDDYARTVARGVFS